MAFDAPPLARATAIARIRRLRAHPVARALLAAADGTRVLLVGGATRDAALGRRVGDLDAVVATDGEAIAERLARALGGRAIALAPRRFAALRIAAPDLEVDLWDLSGGSLDDDLARRDLTLNAIALDLGSGEILDPHRGLEDLSRRILRAVTPRAFAEDPLRVLRLARLAMALGGFTVARDTARRARAAAPGLDSVAGERIRDELAQLAANASAETEQRWLARIGAYPRLWASNSPLTVAPSRAARFARYALARRELDPTATYPGDLAARHALRLLSAADAPPPSARLARLAERAIVSRSEARAIARILELPHREPPPAARLASWIARLGPYWASAFAVASACAPPGRRAAWNGCRSAATELVTRRGEAVVAPRPLLDGHEVARLLGVSEGPAVGDALAALLEAQLAEEVRDVEGAKRFLLGRRKE